MAKKVSIDLKIMLLTFVLSIEMMGDYGMEDEYGMNMNGEMMEEDDGYGDQGDEEESLNFDDNPEYAHLPKLDRMRKIRREILKTINDVREAHQAPSIYLDPFACKAANDYANYLLTNPEDEAKAKEICKDFHVVGEVVPLVGFALLEEDEDHQEPLHENCMDAHGLLLELEYELAVLADANNTHIGIGFAYTKEQVKVVEFVTKKSIHCNQLNVAEDQGVEARGIALSKEVGLYAVRIVALSKMKKDIKVIGPGNIQYQKSTGSFIVNIPGPVEDVFYCYDDLKVL